jgi:hypothetical protein
MHLKLCEFFFPALFGVQAVQCTLHLQSIREGQNNILALQEIYPTFIATASRPLQRRKIKFHILLHGRKRSPKMVSDLTWQPSWYFKNTLVSNYQWFSSNTVRPFFVQWKPALRYKPIVIYTYISYIFIHIYIWYMYLYIYMYVTAKEPQNRDRLNLLHSNSVEERIKFN